MNRIQLTEVLNIELNAYDNRFKKRFTRPPPPIYEQHDEFDECP